MYQVCMIELQKYGAMIKITRQILKKLRHGRLINQNDPERRCRQSRSTLLYYRLYYFVVRRQQPFLHKALACQYV